MKEKVSIIIPTYKRAEKLGRAIDSVLSQTYSNIEVIIVDDNSEGDSFREETNKFMLKYEANPKVIYLKHKVNRNGSAARNTGIKVASGSYVGFLDDDDYFEKDKITLQIKCLERKDNSYGGVSCEHNVEYKSWIYKKNKIDINSSGKYLYELLSGKVVLAAGSTLLVKKEVFDIIGGFDESYERHQDYEFLLRFFRKYKLAIVNKKLVNITVDGVRNYPSANRFQVIKEKFLMDFSQDILSLTTEEINKVLFHQWSEVYLYYISELDFKSSRKLYNDKIKSTGIKFNSFIFVKKIILIIERKIPIISPLKYYLLGFIDKIKSLWLNCSKIILKCLL